MITNKAQLDLVDQFLADLERSSGATHEKISFEKTWDADPPQEAHGLSLLEYMEGVRTSYFLHNPITANSNRHVVIPFFMRIIIASTSLEMTIVRSFQRIPMLVHL